MLYRVHFLLLVIWKGQWLKHIFAFWMALSQLTNKLPPRYEAYLCVYAYLLMFWKRSQFIGCFLNILAGPEFLPKVWSPVSYSQKRLVGYLLIQACMAFSCMKRNLSHPLRPVSYDHLTYREGLLLLNFVNLEQGPWLNARNKGNKAKFGSCGKCQP